MKIIHCSDIHLDSRMETNLPAEKARDRNNEIIQTFIRLIDYAKSNGVRVVMICGDLFDTDRIRLRTADYVLSAIEQAGDIDFLYLKGNHDEGRDVLAGRRLPENLKLFSDEWRYYRYGDVCIAGVEVGEENANSVYQELSLSGNDTNLVMMHGQIGTQCGAARVCLPRLRDRHIHYLALGHLHAYQEERLDLSGRYAYSGCLEGRGFDECGEKGFVLLDVSDGKVTSNFVPFAARRLYDVSVDITGLCSASEIQAAMEDAVRDIDARQLVKFTICGSYTPDTRKDFPFLLRAFSSRFYFVKIKDESKLSLDPESFEHDISLKGEFIRLVMASDKSQEEKERIIMMGIQAISGEEIT